MFKICCGALLAIAPAVSAAEFAVRLPSGPKAILPAELRIQSSFEVIAVAIVKLPVVFVRLTVCVVVASVVIAPSGRATGDCR